MDRADYDTLRAQLEAAEAEVARLAELEKVNDMFRTFVIGEGAYERFCGLQARAEAAEAECARLRDDAERMDWLVCHSVEVRYPLRHGSRHLFHAQQLNDECDEHETDLRAQIDAARTKEQQA